jgi:hypothetical protein
MKLALAVIALITPVAVFGQIVNSGSTRQGDAPASLEKTGTFKGDVARAFGDKFATCIVNRHSVQVVKTLSMAPDSPEQYEALKKLFDPKCISYKVSVTADPMFFRGSLFKAMVRKHHSKEVLIFAAESISVPGRNNSMISFADCVVRLNSGSSLLLIRSVPGSDEEKEAINALRPQLNDCLAAGSTISLEKPNLTAAISEAYYREAIAMREAGAN